MKCSMRLALLGALAIFGGCSSPASKQPETPQPEGAEASPAATPIDSRAEPREALPPPSHVELSENKEHGSAEAPDGNELNVATAAADHPPPQPQAKEIRFNEHYPKQSSFSLLEFKKSNGLSGPNYELRCWALEKVGSPPVPGLLCLSHNARPEFTLAGVYRIEEKTLRLVWQETVFTYMNWLELTPLVSDEGVTLTLNDRRPHSCEVALSEYRAKVSARVAPPSGELLEPACRKRGKYSYINGRYRLVEQIQYAPSPYFPFPPPSSSDQ